MSDFQKTIILDDGKVQSLLKTNNRTDIFSIFLVILLYLPLIIVLRMINNSEYNKLPREIISFILILCYVLLLLSQIIDYITSRRSVIYHKYLVGKNIKSKIEMDDSGISYPNYLFSPTIYHNNRNTQIKMSTISNILIWINTRTKNKALYIIYYEDKHRYYFELTQYLIQSPIESIGDVLMEIIKPVNVIVVTSDLNKNGVIRYIESKDSSLEKIPFGFVKQMPHISGTKYDTGSSL